MGEEWIQVLAVDAFLMGCIDKRSARSALDRDPKTVDEAVSLMRRFYDHKKALSVERRVRTLALEEGDPVAPQVNRVQEERSGSLDVGKLNEKLLANINMAGPGRRMGPVKRFSCGETGHIARYCRSNVQRPYPRPRDILGGGVGSNDSRLHVVEPPRRVPTTPACTWWNRPEVVPTTPACTWWNRPEEDNSSGKLESTHPSRTSVKSDQVFLVSSQSCVSTLTHYSSELLLPRHQGL